MGQGSSGWALAILFGGSAACTVAHYETGNDSDAYDAADGATADLTVYRDTIAPLDSNPADRIQTADIVSPPPDVPLRTDAVVDIPIVPDVPPPPDVVATNDVVSEPDAPPEASMADVACGAPGQACCMPGNACDAGSECLSTQTCATCGGDGDRCCTGNPACTDSAASCVTVPNPHGQTLRSSGQRDDDRGSGRTVHQFDDVLCVGSAMCKRHVHPVRHLHAQLLSSAKRLLRRDNVRQSG